MKILCVLAVPFLGSCAGQQALELGCELLPEYEYASSQSHFLLRFDKASQSVELTGLPSASDDPKESVIVKYTNNSNIIIVENFVIIPRDILNIEEWGNSDLECRKIKNLENDLISFRCAQVGLTDYISFDFSIKRGIVAIYAGGVRQVLTGDRGIGGACAN